MLNWLRALLIGESRIIAELRYIRSAENGAFIVLSHAQNNIIERLTRMETNMANQADIDALKATIDQLGGDLSTALSGIQSDLDAAVQANPGVDLSALQASVGTLSEAVLRAQQIDGENPAAPVESDPAPSDPPVDGQ